MKAATAAAVLCLALTLGACGDLGGRYHPSALVPSARVDQRALGRYPAGSPERAVLEWYGALQRQDVPAARRFYPRSLRPDVLRLLMGKAAPFFTNVELGPLTRDRLGGGTATVVTELRTRWELPNGTARERRTSQAFTLVRDGARWRFADTYFLRFAGRYPPSKQFTRS